MMRFLNSSTALLWLLIIGTGILLGGQAAGVHWPLSPNVAFGRLLVHPGVAAIEVLFATALILLARLGDPRKNWMTIGLASLAIAFALYHLFRYLVGIDFLLLYGASSMIRERSTPA